MNKLAKKKPHNYDTAPRETNVSVPRSGRAPPPLHHGGGAGLKAR